MSVLNSFEYVLERWRYQSFLGLRKIIWFYTILGLLSLFPAFITGTLIGSFFVAKTSSVAVTKLFTERPNFKLEASTALSYTGDKRGFYAKVSNKIDDTRKTIGYDPWVYKYTISDSTGKVVDQGSHTSYLLPNADSYIVGPVISGKGIKFDVTTDLENSVPTKFDLASSKLPEIPVIKVSNTSNPELVPDHPELVKIKFSLNNQSYYTIGTVDCTFIIRNVDNQIIGIGTYAVNNLVRQTIRTVEFNYPAPTLGTNTTLEVYPQFNYLNEENLKLQLYDSTVFSSSSSSSSSSQ